MTTHLAATFQSPGAAFTGGFARIAMKQMASSLNLYVPQQYREEYPFLSNFAIGVGFSPLLNLPRMLQLGRIGGQSYPQASTRLRQSPESVLECGMVFAHSHQLISSQTCVRGRCGTSLIDHARLRSSSVGMMFHAGIQVAVYDGGGLEGVRIQHGGVRAWRGLPHDDVLRHQRLPDAQGGRQGGRPKGTLH
jgi:hypothetical protein